MMLMYTLAFQHAETSISQCEFQLKHAWGQVHSILFKAEMSVHVMDHNHT